MVNDNDADQCAYRFQLQTQLLLQGCDKGRSSGIDARWSLARLARQRITSKCRRRVGEIDIESTRDAGAIDQHATR